MLHENDVIGGCRVLGQIGKGGTGIIYLAYHQNLQKYVVLKQINICGNNAEILRRESDILKNLHHTYLPQIYDCIIRPDYVYTVMDYIDGKDLEHFPAGTNELPEEYLLRWFRQMVEVLVYLERQNPPIVHSDIKPQNIIIRENGDICLIDFNISFAESLLDRMQGLTPDFASPEQKYMGNLINQGIVPEFTLDTRTDIYSTGATFYYMLTGRKAALMQEVPPLASDPNLPYSQGFLAIIDKCLRPNRDERFRNAQELQKALGSLKKMESRYRKYLILRVASIIGSTAIIALGAFFLAHGLLLRTKEGYRREVAALVQLVEAGQDAEAEALDILNKDSYKKLMEDSPESAATVYRALGDVYYRRRDFQAAATTYQNALNYAKKAGGDKTEYYRNLGLALAYAGAMQEARDVYYEAQMDNAGSVALAQIALAIAISEDSQDTCIAEAEAILSGTTEEQVLLQTCFSMSDYFQGKGKLDKALSWLDRAASYGESNELLERKGAIYLEKMRLSDREEERRQNARAAIEVYRRLCAGTDALISDHINLAIALRAQGNTGEAVQELEKVLEMDPVNCTATMYLAVLHRERGSGQRAREYARSAMELYEKLSMEKQQEIDRNLVAAVREIAGR